MSHEWDSGFMTRLPSWHHKENAVLKESPRSWPAARKEAGLEWDVETEPVYQRVPGVQDDDLDFAEMQMREVDGYQLLTRDDTHATLAVQATSYAVIRNEQFGYLIDALLGLEGDEYVDFEALMSLYGGRSIVALVTFPALTWWSPAASPSSGSTSPSSCRCGRSTPVGARPTSSASCRSPTTCPSVSATTP
jgi:hypothetical protein